MGSTEVRWANSTLDARLQDQLSILLMKNNREKIEFRFLRFRS